MKDECKNFMNYIVFDHGSPTASIKAVKSLIKNDFLIFLKFF